MGILTGGGTPLACSQAALLGSFDPLLARRTLELHQSKFWKTMNCDLLGATCNDEVGNGATIQK